MQSLAGWVPRKQYAVLVLGPLASLFGTANGALL
jgi:hypothetical protein